MLNLGTAPTHASCGRDAHLCSTWAWYGGREGPSHSSVLHELPSLLSAVLLFFRSSKLPSFLFGITSGLRMRGIVVHQISISITLRPRPLQRLPLLAMLLRQMKVGRATKCDYVDNASPLAIARYISMAKKRRTCRVKATRAQRNELMYEGQLMVMLKF